MIFCIGIKNSVEKRKNSAAGMSVINWRAENKAVAFASFLDKRIDYIVVEYASVVFEFNCALHTPDAINKYFTIAQMPVVSSSYWNMVHGNAPEQVESDLEGLQTMRNAARNLIWLMKCIETRTDTHA